jgi:hypothetical protein
LGAFADGLKSKTGLFREPAKHLQNVDAEKISMNLEPAEGWLQAIAATKSGMTGVKLIG